MRVSPTRPVAGAAAHARPSSPTSISVVDVTFEAPLTLPELHGTVLDSLQQPVAGMQVQATTVATPTAQRRWCRRRRRPTRPAPSRFAWWPARPTRCMLTATPTNAAAGPLPSLARRRRHDQAGADQRAHREADDAAPAGARRGQLQPRRASARAARRCRCTNATCIFTADVSDPHATDGTTATYQTSSMADALTGQVTVDLIPAESATAPTRSTVTPDADAALRRDDDDGQRGPAARLTDRRPPARAAPAALGADPRHRRQAAREPDGRAGRLATVAAALAATPSTASTTPQQATAVERRALRRAPRSGRLGHRR